MADAAFTTENTSRGPEAPINPLTSPSPRERIWRYRASDPISKASREGIMGGADAATVRAAIRATGWMLDALEDITPAVPVTVSRIGSSTGAAAAGAQLRQRLNGWWQARMRKRRRLAVADLWESLVTLLAVGMPLDQALSHLAAAPTRPRDQRRMVASLAMQVRQGRTMAAACQAHSDWFDAVDGAMIAAGTRSGHLTEALSGLAAHHQHAAQARHRLVVALTYPLILLIAAIAVVAFISTQTLPQLLGMLTEARLPTPTLSVVVMHIGQFIVHWGIVVIPAVTIAGLWGVRRVQRLDTTTLIGRWWATTPLARAQVRGRVAEIASTLARLQASGVPLADAIDVTAQAAGDADLAQVLHQAAAAVRRGEALSASITTSSLFDGDFAQLLRLGERSGELAKVLATLADRYRIAAQRAHERLAAVLEPLSVLTMAAIIGTVVIAAVLPLVALGNLV